MRPARTGLAAAGIVLVVLAVLAGLRMLVNAKTYQLFGRVVARVETVERVVALTFDDGPMPDTLDAVLEALRRGDVHATFFVTGAALDEYPGAGRRLVEAGHELGNHTYSHARMIFRRPGFVRAELDATDALIRATGQTGPIYFRPPFGDRLVVLPWLLARRNTTTVMWDVDPDSFPTVAATAAGIVDDTLDRVRPGSIILLHVWPDSRRTSLAALPGLIEGLHARAYRFVTLRELLARAVA